MPVKIMQPQIDCDFSEVSFHDAVIKFKIETGHEPDKMIIGAGYNQAYILEAIFRVRGKIDFPFEVSYVLPRDAWLLMDGEGNLFYGPGA